MSFSEGLLAAAGGDHDTARERLEDAVELFAASGAPFEMGQARLELAAVLVERTVRTGLRARRQRRSGGLRRSGLGESARARELLKRLGVAPQAGRLHTVMRSSPPASSRSSAWSRMA